MVDPRFWYRIAYPLYAFAFTLLLAVDASAHQQGRQALARPRRHPAPAVGADEGGAGPGAGPLLPQRLPVRRQAALVPDPAAARDRPARRPRPRSSPTSAPPSCSALGRRAPVHGRACGFGSSCSPAPSAAAALPVAWQDARLSAPAHPHLPRPRAGPARAPATTSSSPRSRSAPAGFWARAGSTAPRPSSASCPRSRPTSPSPCCPRRPASSARSSCSACSWR